MLAWVRVGMAGRALARSHGCGEPTSQTQRTFTRRNGEKAREDAEADELWYCDGSDRLTRDEYNAANVRNS